MLVIVPPPMHRSIDSYGKKISKRKFCEIFLLSIFLRQPGLPVSVKLSPHCLLALNQSGLHLHDLDDASA